jgi:hypothetical protein
MKDLSIFFAFGFLFLTFSSKLFAATDATGYKLDKHTNGFNWNATCADLSGVWEGFCRVPGDENVPRTPSSVIIKQTGCNEFVIDNIEYNLGIPVKTGSRNSDGDKIETYQRVNWMYDDQTHLYETISETWTPGPNNQDIPPFTIDRFENKYSLLAEKLFVVRRPVAGNYSDKHCKYEKK